MISEDKIKEIVNRIVENVNPEKIILFGSYAYGQPNEDSDLDVLVIQDVDIPVYKRGKQVKQYLRGIKTPVDIVVRTPDEIKEWRNTKASFIYDAMQKGKVLYEQK